MRTKLSISTLTNAILAKPNGQIGTIEYYSEKPTINGDIIYKVTKTQFHKVDYKKTKNYVAPTFTRKDNSTYLVKGWLKEHNNTHNILLNIVPFNSKCHKTTYFDSNWNEISQAEAEAQMKPSAKSNAPTSIYTIKATQVFSYK